MAATTPTVFTGTAERVNRPSAPVRTLDFSAAEAVRTVTGQVRDAVSGQPVAGAVVHAAAEKSSVRTGADGRFTLSAVPVNTVGVVAAKQGYSFRWLPLEERGNTSVTLRLDRETEQNQPHPDYPRPDVDRRAGADGKWLNLNGTWSLGFDPQNVGLDQGWANGREWEHAVRVPFSYTSLAGVGEEARANNQVYASQFEANRGAAWYQRQFTVPRDWPADRDVLLRFGAVEWNATVFLDGAKRAEHDGGYSPFDVDLGRLAPGSTHSLVVRSFAPDNSERTPYPQGKQMGWYADTAGIWQTVWLEPADAARLDTVHVSPKLTFDGDRLTSAKAEVAITGNAAAKGSQVKVTVREQAGRPGAQSQGLNLPKPVEPKAGRVVASTTTTLGEGTATSTVDVPEARLWSPDTPWLYQVQVELSGPGGRDALHTWTGLRTVSRDWAPGHSPAEQSNPKEQYQYLHLNNKPVYLRSALDQAFNPWGVYSYTGLYQGADLRAGSVADPRKGSVLFDLALAKQLGLNSTRLHIKINDPLYYHWADVMGLMVWYDQPNFGYRGYQEQAEKLFEGVLHDAVKRDYNHASIVIWDVFNEGWGIANPDSTILEHAKPWIERMVQLAKQLTKGGRLIVDNSPCCDNHHPSESTDLLDFHGYLSTWDEWKSNVDNYVNNTYPGSSFNMEEGKKQAGQPLMNSEFGPWSGGREKDQDVSAPFRYTTELFRNQPKMNGYLFTELADIEWEWNGWSAYDRTLQIPGYLDAEGEQGGVHLANADDVLLFDARPVQRITPGQQLSLTAKSSLFSGRDVSGTQLRWRISGTDATGTPLRPTAWQQRPVSPKKYTTTDLGKVEVTVPGGLTSGRLDIQLVRGRDVLATGQTFLADWSAATDRATVLGEQRTSPSRVAGTVRLDPAAATAKWPQGHDTFRNDGSSATWGYGDGEFQWTVDLPDELRDGRWNNSQLVVEASASRPGMPRTRFPQTSERRYPTEFRASVDGVSTKSVVLPDDPADARGSLSNESGFDPGQYGYRVVLELDARKLKEAAKDGKFTVSLAGAGGGLTVLGPRTGRYGISPQLVFSQGRGVAGPELTKPEGYIGTTEGAGVSTHFVPGALKNGQPTQASVLVVNDSPRTVRQVRPELVLPAGWRAEPVGAVSTVDLRPGESAVARFRLVPGSVGEVTVTTRAFYTGEAGRAVVDEPWLVTVPVPEPSEANYPRRTVLDGFDSDTSAGYRSYQPFGGEVAPAPTVSESKLKVTSATPFFSMIGSEVAPGSNPAVTIVEVGQLAGGNMRENSLFTGLVKDQGTYVVAWYNHFRKQAGFDVRLNGEFLAGNPTARLDLQPGDKFALVVSGRTLTIFHGRDGQWTEVRTGSVDPRLNLGDPTVLAQFRHGLAMRGDGGTVSVESFEGRTR